MRKSPSAATRKRAASELGEAGDRSRKRRAAAPDQAPEPIEAEQMPSDEHVETGETDTDESAE